MKKVSVQNTIPIEDVGRDLFGDGNLPSAALETILKPYGLFDRNITVDGRRDRNFPSRMILELVDKMIINGLPSTISVAENDNRLSILFTATTENSGLPYLASISVGAGGLVVKYQDKDMETVKGLVAIDGSNYEYIEQTHLTTSALKTPIIKTKK